MVMQFASDHISLDVQIATGVWQARQQSWRPHADITIVVATTEDEDDG